jgi:hypothetical protein
MASIIQFLDTCTHANGSLLQQICGENEVTCTNAFRQFAEENSSAWKSDVEMDVNKIIVDSLTLTSSTINLKLLLSMLNQEQMANFWHLLCQVIGRDGMKLYGERMALVEQLASDFSAELSKIGIDMTPRQAYDYVCSNAQAIKVRFSTKLSPILTIPSESSDSFWEYMEEIYNCANPYDKIHFTPSDNHNMISKVMSKVQSFAQGCTADSNPQEFLGQLMNSNVAQDLMGMFDPNKINFGSLFQTLVSAIPQMDGDK